jgi:hypothetical protein
VGIDGVGEFAHLAIELGDLGGAPLDDFGLRAIRPPARVDHERAELRELVGALAPELAQAAPHGAALVRRGRRGRERVGRRRRRGQGLVAGGRALVGRAGVVAWACRKWTHRCGSTGSVLQGLFKRPAEPLPHR